MKSVVFEWQNHRTYVVQASFSVPVGFFDFGRKKGGTEGLPPSNVPTTNCHWCGIHPETKSMPHVSVLVPLYLCAALLFCQIKSIHRMNGRHAREQNINKHLSLDCGQQNGNKKREKPAMQYKEAISMLNTLMFNMNPCLLTKFPFFFAISLDSVVCGTMPNSVGASNFNRMCVYVCAVVHLLHRVCHRPHIADKKEFAQGLYAMKLQESGDYHKR